MASNGYASTKAIGHEIPAGPVLRANIMNETRRVRSWALSGLVQISECPLRAASSGRS
jgi:hypothetical protein